MNEETKTEVKKKKRIHCRHYCYLWDTNDRDCEIYGENHPRLMQCPYFRKEYNSLYNELLEKHKQDVENKV